MKLTSKQKYKVVEKTTINISSTFYSSSLLLSLPNFLQKITENDLTITYNDIAHQLLNPNSNFHTNSKGINIILFRLKDLHHEKLKSEEITHILDQFIAQIENYNQSSNIPLILCLCPQNTYSYSKSLVNTFMKKVQERKLGYLIKNKEIQSTSHVSQIFDDFGEKQGHLPYTLDYFQALSKTIARVFYSFYSKPKKVIVLDCDDTLWDGKIGEDGIDGITINEQRKYLQNFFLDKFNQGFLLCLCSKNNEDDVWSVFKNRSDMILKKEHITAWRINWKQKSENIISLSNILNLSLDSFIFIDDDAAQIGEVRLACKEVLCVQVPKLDILIPTFLQSIWGLENFGNQQRQLGSTRSDFYKNIAKRTKLQEETNSFSDFLKQLKVQTIIRPIENNDFERVCELMQRSNQFNFNKWPLENCNTHYLQNLIKFKHYSCLVVDVEDCYDKYGLVGLILYYSDNDKIIVDSFILSCRALGKGVEHKMLNAIGGLVSEHNQESVHVIFKNTNTNRPALSFLMQTGFKEDFLYYSLPATTARKIAPLDWEHKNESEKRVNSINPVIVDQNLLIQDMVEQAIQNCNSHKIRSFSPIRPLEDIDNYLKNLTHKLNCPVEAGNSLVSSGFDSLLAIHFASIIFKDLGVHLQYASLLSSDCTLKTLEHLIQKKIAQNKNKLLPTKIDQNTPIPLSLEQSRLWSFYSEKSQNSAYNMSVIFQLSGNLKLDALEKAFHNLLITEDIFCTTFPKNLHTPTQYINLEKIRDFKFILHDEIETSQIETILKDWVNQPFNLENDLLFRVKLFRIEHESYILGVCIPHIIHDAISFRITMQKLAYFYSLYSKGHIPKNTIHYNYRNYVNWQNKLFTIRNQKNTHWWKNNLENKVISKLPVMIKGETAQKNSRRHFKLKTSLSRQIEQLSQKTKSTNYQVLLAIFSILICKYIRRKDTVILTVSNGRQIQHTDEMIGFFVNLLLLGININKSDSFLQLVEHIKRTILGSLKHQDYSLAEQLSMLETEEPGLLPIGFIYQNYDPVTLPLDSICCTSKLSNSELLYDMASETRLGPITMYMGKFENKFIGLVEYDTSLFNENTISSLIAHFMNIINKIVADPAKPALNHSLLSKSETNLLINVWSNDKKGKKNHDDILTIFQKKVKQYPNKIAVLADKDQFSYLELDERSTQLSIYLKQNLSLTKEDCIAFCLPRNIYEAITILAILKSGCAYVPISKADPTDRLKHILKDTHSKAIITLDANVDFFETFEIKTIAIDDDYMFQAQDELSFAFNPLETNQLAYVMYTSGSTGLPKGVLIEQQGIVRLVSSTNYIDLNSEDRIAQFSNACFDAATFEFWGALLNGGTLVYPPYDVLSDFNKLSHFLSKNCITVAWFTAALFETLAFINSSLFINLRYLLAGGDILNPKAVHHVLMCPEGRPRYILNGYGPTENTTFTTVFEIKSCDSNESIPIGSAINNTELYVLDAQLLPTPMGIPGTLYVGGQGLARGYLNQDELTKKKFVDIIIEGKRKRLYNTGDLVCWNENGLLKFIGREDNQIKLRGYRIDLREIEQKILSHPLIKQAAVVITAEEHLTKKSLVAYYVTYPSTELFNSDNLRQFLTKILPPHMIPSMFVEKNQLPMTVNGKVDRKLLAKFSPENPCNHQIEAETLSQTENTLLEIINDILLTENRIGAFSELSTFGFTSITLIGLLHKIRQTFEIEMSASELWSFTTITELAKFIDANKKYQLSDKNRMIFVEVQPGNPKKHYPLILIHPAGGNTHCYKALIDALDKEQPCYVIEDLSLIENQVVWNDIPEIASFYLLLISKTKFVEKPFILGGWSFGGMVAAEMVLQNSRSNTSEFNIQTLMLFDTWVVSDLSTATKEQLIGQIIRNQAMTEINNSDLLLEIFSARQKQGFSYKPSEKIKIPILLFKATALDEIISIQDDYNNWRNYSDQITVIKVEGNHHTLLNSPNIKYLSNLIIKLTTPLPKRTYFPNIEFFKSVDKTESIENKQSTDYSFI